MNRAEKLMQQCEAFDDPSDIGKKPVPKYSRRITKKDLDQMLQHQLDGARCIFVTDPKHELGVYVLHFPNSDEETVLVY